jgi:hypothetical protein
MSDREDLRAIIEEIEYLLAKLRQRALARPRLVVTHGHRRPETTCLQGETIDYVYIQYGHMELPLRLSLTGLMIVDCLARYRLNGLNAVQIERILSSDPFYLRHGANVPDGNRAAIRPSRKSIKVYIQRIRVQLREALRKAGLDARPERILVSQTTESNVVVYCLNAAVEFRHH